MGNFPIRNTNEILLFIFIWPRVPPNCATILYGSSRARGTNYPTAASTSIKIGGNNTCEMREKKCSATFTPLHTCRCDEHVVVRYYVVKGFVEGLVEFWIYIDRLLYYNNYNIVKMFAVLTIPLLINLWYLQNHYW